MIKATVQRHNGTPTLFLNDQPVTSPTLAISLYYTGAANALQTLPPLPPLLHSH